MSDRQLAQLDHAARLLAEAKTLPEVKVIADVFEAARVYAKRSKAGIQVINRAVAGKLKSERKGGELLDQMLDGKRHNPTARTLRAVGLNFSQSQRWQQAARVSEEDFQNYLAVCDDEEREAHSAGLYKLAIRKAAEQRENTVPDSASAAGKNWEMRFGDFRELLKDVPDASVDLVVTDPPYETSALELWSDLALLARRVLCPRGLLLAWTGQIHLPEVMTRLSESLTFGWMFALL